MNNFSCQSCKPRTIEILSIRSLVFFLIFPVGTVPFLSLGCSKVPSRKNVIMVTVDTLRADRLGCYGFPLPTSPALDRFSKYSLLFEHAFSHASSTCPSLAALMTSLSPLDAGVPTNRYPLDPPTPTLAEVLRNEGYMTAAFVSNFVLRKGKGFEKGFIHYDDTMKNKEIKRHRVSERIATDTVSAVLDWLNNDPCEPFFLWVHFQDPHGPYNPPPPYDTMFNNDPYLSNHKLTINRTNTGIGGIPYYQALNNINDLQYYATRYLGEIRFFDAAFDELDRFLDKSGLYDRSIIIFTSDHGEGMGEHDYYFAHGEYLYQNQIHVPLLIRAPGIKPGRLSMPVSLSAIYPSVLSYLGIKEPFINNSYNILNHHDIDRPIFSMTMKTVNVTTNRWSLIYRNRKLIFSEPGLWEYYNILTDPDELSDTYSKGSDSLDRDRKMLLAFISKKRKTMRRTIPFHFDHETEEKLRELGYGF